MIALLAIFLSGLTVGAVTRESSHCGGLIPLFERTPGASAILGPAFHLPAIKLRPASWPDGETLTGRKSSLGMVHGESPRQGVVSRHETPGDSFGMYWLLPFLPDGAGLVPAGQFFAWPLEI